MSGTVLTQIAALKTKSTPELREMWKELFAHEELRLREAAERQAA